MTLNSLTLTIVKEKKLIPLDIQLPRLTTTDSRVKKAIEEELDCEIPRWGSEAIKKVRDALEELKDSYYSNYSLQGPDYSSVYTQIAYAFNYYPLYIEQISSVLELIQKHRIDNSYKQNLHEKWVTEWVSGTKTLNIGLVGSGSAPELYGIWRYINQLLRLTKGYKIGCPKISIDCFEKTSEWRWLYDCLTWKFLKKSPRFLVLEKQKKFVVKRHRVDVLEKIPDCTKSKILSAYDLVVMQNVTNELGEKVTDGLLENMKFLLERTKKKNGYLIMTTRGLQNRGLTKSLRILEKKDVSLNLILDGKIQLEPVIKQNKILEKFIYNDIYPRRDNAFQTIVVEGNKK